MATKVKGVEEALKAVKGGASKKRTTTKKKAAAKKKAPAKKKAAKQSTAKKAAAKKAPVKKKAAKKTSAKKATKASSGQSGPSLDLPVEKISAKEMRVVELLNGSGSGTRTIYTIEEMAGACWKSKSKKQSNSWVRNSLRRLIRSGVVEKVERGKYRISDAGRKKLARSEAA